MHKNRSSRPGQPPSLQNPTHLIPYTMEGHFPTINNCVADVIGLFEKKTFALGESDEEL